MILSMPRDKAPVTDGFRAYSSENVRISLKRTSWLCSTISKHINDQHILLPKKSNVKHMGHFHQVTVHSIKCYLHPKCGMKTTQDDNTNTFKVWNSKSHWHHKLKLHIQHLAIALCLGLDGSLGYLTIFLTTTSSALLNGKLCGFFSHKWGVC